MRNARLYKNRYKTGEFEMVKFHCFCRVGNANDDLGVVAVLEKDDGSIVEAGTERMVFDASSVEKKLEEFDNLFTRIDDNNGMPYRYVTGGYEAIRKWLTANLESLMVHWE